MSEQEDVDFVDEEMEKQEGQTTEKLYGIDQILSQDGKDGTSLLDRYTDFGNDRDMIFAIAEQRLVNKLINALIKGEPLKMEWFDQYYRDVERMLVSLFRGGRNDVKGILGFRLGLEEAKKKGESLMSRFFGGGTTQSVEG